MGVVLLGGVCAGADGAEGEVASYGGGGWNILSRREKNIHQFGLSNNLNDSQRQNFRSSCLKNA